MKYTQTDLKTKEIVLTTFGQIMASLKSLKLKPEQIASELKSGKTLKSKNYAYKWQVIDLDDYYPTVTNYWITFGSIGFHTEPEIHYFEDVISATEFKDESEDEGFTSLLDIPELYKNANLSALEKNL